MKEDYELQHGSLQQPICDDQFGQNESLAALRGEVMIRNA